jgi:hypothetical protein
MVDMAGNSAHFNTMGSDELARMALGYELKGLLLNYAQRLAKGLNLLLPRRKRLWWRRTWPPLRMM